MRLFAALPPPPTAIKTLVNDVDRSSFPCFRRNWIRCSYKLHPITYIILRFTAKWCLGLTMHPVSPEDTMIKVLAVPQPLTGSEAVNRLYVGSILESNAVLLDDSQYVV
jgi:hypothetical protein